ncbi:hypothetical protein JEG43_12250 [Anoxybacillus sp. LAT_35]|nr:hypothetical protein [Anoxybacillus sp. LAT_11]MCG6175308.1 hypothetical protein [Anoxybacillus sp. LAT_31]MCG6178780.1 hypothetical protein [Anoxybacillus sp. LAT_35]MCG6179315.1 hypothetical protein [Anoxybacillus sp. LAT_33]MCG6185618.1 hypothetical protein [Anoxybacillus sp. LAT_26]MCG6195751.1 hypothetical protein [Anoxybacillus sp. LAT_38]
MANDIVKGGLLLKRIVIYFLLCTMLAGCNYQGIHLQAQQLDEKKQGFDKEEVESFIREPKKVNHAINPQLKNKDIVNLFLLGLTKEEMKHMDSEELHFFSNKSSINKWNNLNEQALRDIFKKQTNDQIIQCDLYKQMLCTASTIYTVQKKKVMELTMSISLLNREEPRYAVVLSYKWLTNPQEKKANFYGVLTTENAVVDYREFYSYYKTYKDASHISAKHYNKPYQSSVIGYAIKNFLNKENSRHFGYLYAEIVPSDRTHKYIDVEGFYIHADEDHSFSFQDVLDAGVNDDMVMFKSPITRIAIKK